MKNYITLKCLGLGEMPGKIYKEQRIYLIPFTILSTALGTKEHAVGR